MHRTLAIVGFMSWGFACSGRSAPLAPVISVRPGLEVLIEDSLHLVQGRRVGLVTNQGGVDARGVPATERLRAAGVNVVALFSPEHGFRGTAAPGESIASARDSATGLPIYSLYGRTSSPTDSMLRGIEILLIDLPDVGARYYTYLSTTVEVMRAAGRHQIPVLVLDRPDPIGGAVQGNVLDTAYRSFIGMLAVPMRHGLTLGEQARLARHDLGIDVVLGVVPVAGWKRSQALDDVGLPFVKPSPNLPTMESLFHYPGICLFEGTNLSVGRGSDAPFEQIGAPWLDTAAVLAAAHAAGIPGVAFAAVRFTPRAPGDGKYADSSVAGIRLTVTDRASYDPTITAVTLLSIILKTHPGKFHWIPAQFDRLAGGPGLRKSLTDGRSPAGIIAEWEAPRARYLERRQEFLLYPAD